MPAGPVTRTKAKWGRSRRASNRASSDDRPTSVTSGALEQAELRVGSLASAIAASGMGFASASAFTLDRGCLAAGWKAWPPRDVNRGGPGPAYFGALVGSLFGGMAGLGAAFAPMFTPATVPWITAPRASATPNVP